MIPAPYWLAEIPINEAKKPKNRMKRQMPRMNNPT